jgi:hypothetical protein
VNENKGRTHLRQLRIGGNLRRTNTPSITCPPLGWGHLGSRGVCGRTAGAARRVGGRCTSGIRGTRGGGGSRARRPEAGGTIRPSSLGRRGLRVRTRGWARLALVRTAVSTEVDFGLSFL